MSPGKLQFLQNMSNIICVWCCIMLFVLRRIRTVYFVGHTFVITTVLVSTFVWTIIIRLTNFRFLSLFCWFILLGWLSRMISPSWSPQTSHVWPNVVSNLCKALQETLPFLNERSNVLLPIPKLFEELTLTPTAWASAFVAVGPFVPSEDCSAILGLS